MFPLMWWLWTARIRSRRRISGCRIELGVALNGAGVGVNGESKLITYLIEGWRLIMRSALSLILPLVFAASMSAQVNQSGAPHVLSPGEMLRGCPINFSVKREAGLVVRNAKDAKADGDGQGLQLNFGRPVVEASLTVHGFSARSRMLPTDNAQGNASQTFHLTRRSDADGFSSYEIWTQKIVSISWVELTEVKYLDGTEWHPAKTLTCYAEPGLLLLTGLQ
jgi:hypothetical protein